jgi:hypothetical protein
LNQKKYLIKIALAWFQSLHNSIMNVTRIPPSQTSISRCIAHLGSRIGEGTSLYHVVHLILIQPISDRALYGISRQEHDTHLILIGGEGQMELRWIAEITKTNAIAPRQKMGGGGQGIVILVHWSPVGYLRLVPSKHTEFIRPSQIDEREIHIT